MAPRRAGTAPKRGAAAKKAGARSSAATAAAAAASSSSASSSASTTKKRGGAKPEAGTAKKAASEEEEGEGEGEGEPAWLRVLTAGGDAKAQAAPLRSAAAKAPLLPAYLRVRGLVRQHIASFDDFVSHGLRQIVLTPSNARVTCDADPSFYLRYTDVWLGTPSHADGSSGSASSSSGGGSGGGSPATPQGCRLRDLTYAAPIHVSIEYLRGRSRVRKDDVVIGRLPIMLRSNHCVLTAALKAAASAGAALGGGDGEGGSGSGSAGAGAPAPAAASGLPVGTEAELRLNGGAGSVPADPAVGGGYGAADAGSAGTAAGLTARVEKRMAELGECAYDPGGYFVVKGQEKVILIQEQLSKNRIIIEGDGTASVTSSTHERKSRTAVVTKHDRLYLKHNTFETDVPIAIVLKAMGVQHDQEIIQLVGSEPVFTEFMLPSLEECVRERVFTQTQAREWIGKHIRVFRRHWQSKRPKADEARDILASVIFNHVPVHAYDFRAKAQYLAVILRRLCLAKHDETAIDDKDYYGNKRLELAGQLMALLFEDLFKRFNAELKRIADTTLTKPQRANEFDIAKSIQQKTISDGLVNALSTGNWTLKRFKMDRAGVTQVLSRQSYISALGMMTRVTSQFEKTRKVSGPRALQPSQFGVLCPSDTPEGESCGLVKNLALLTHITSDDDESQLMRLALDLGVEDVGLVSGDDVNVNRSASRPDARAGRRPPTSVPPAAKKQQVHAKGAAGATGVRVKSEPADDDEEMVDAAGAPLGFPVKKEEEEDNDAAASAAAAAQQAEQYQTTSVGGTAPPYVVFVNGVIVGIHRDPHRFVQTLRMLRRRRRVGEFVSVYLHEKQRTVYIACDGGRVCRPLIVVDQATGTERVTGRHIAGLRAGLCTFDDLVRHGLIEFVDVNEENNSRVALYSSDIEAGVHTHCEIDPLTLLGCVAGLIPYPHHNQSPRNTYQCAMGKQALGVIGYNQQKRIDTMLYLLVYPQKPLCKSKTIELINFERLPAGQNAIIAVMSYSGYDIEDALVVNKAAIDRGFGRCMVLKKMTSVIRKYPNQTTDFLRQRPPGAVEEETPDGVVDPSLRQYSKLGADGMAEPGMELDDGDVYLTKLTPRDTTSAIANPDALPLEAYSPSDSSYRGAEPVIVDQVCVTHNSDESIVVKTLTRQTRRPEIGDKFSSRHGQKGVVGIIVPQEDMPFNDDGMSPDIIMNPHGFPSRMTVGKLIELLAGKSALFDGRLKYGTAFAGDKVDDLSQVLVKNGYQYAGKDMLTSGLTGEPMTAYVYFGPIYYQKLKHMVMDKMHARARGPRVVLTRQPTEGRARSGGLRLGEMERDCVVGYGASNLMMERLMFSSDVFDVFVCSRCGLLSSGGATGGWCQRCRSSIGISKLRIPYAAKLLFQELTAMGIIPRLSLSSQ